MYQEQPERRESREPLVIEARLPFVAINDLDNVVARLAPNIDRGRLWAIETNILRAIDQFTYAEAELSFVSGDDLYQWLERKVVGKLGQSGEKIGVVLMDRYVFPEIQNERIIRMNLSRSIDGGLVTRPGENKSVVEQFEEMFRWIDNGKFERICIVDDVLAFGDTMMEYLKVLGESYPNVVAELIVGIASSGGDWRGLEIVRDDLGVKTECMMIVKAGEKIGDSLGMALPTLRDFTVFGGKIGSLEDGTKTSYPYFLPFSITKVAFGPIEGRYRLANTLTNLSRKLITEIESANTRPLLVSDVMRSGFGLPSSSVKSLSPYLLPARLEMRFMDYIDSMGVIAGQKIQEIDAEQLVTK